MVDPRKSLTQKLVFWFIITTIIPIIIAGALTLNLATETLEKEYFSKLDSIATLKVNSIHSIFGEIKSDTILAQKYLNVRINLPIISNYYDNTNNSNYIDAKKKLDEQLSSYLTEKTLVDDIILLDSDGKFIYHNNKIQSKWFGSLFQFIDSDILDSAKNEQKFTKIFLDENYKSEATMFSLISIYDIDEKFVGYFILDLNMRQIFELIQDKTGLGETGETLLGIKDNNFAVFINPLRYDVNASFVKKVALDDDIARPIRESVQGIDGSGLTMDYRPQPIIAVWKYIPFLDWGIVAKIDQSEAFSSINSLQHSTTILAITFTVIVGVIGFVVSRNIVSPILALKRNAENIRKGIFDDLLPVTGKDELSSVSESFNKMSQDLFRSKKNLEDFKDGLDKSAIVAITDKNGIITYANQMFCEISKFSEDELIGKSHSILKSGYHTDAFYKDLWDTISRGNTWYGEIKNKTKDGDYYWVKTMIMPILNNDGQITQYLSIRIDITPQKRLTKKLIKTERLSSIGQLASRMAHDIRNPLSVIRVSLDNIQLKYGIGGDTRESFDRISRSIDRIAHQIDGVLDFVKEKQVILSNVLFSQVLAESIDSMNIPNSIKLILPKNDVEIFADKKLFSIVMNNLILNGIQAIDGEGAIEIILEESNNEIIIQVIDSGTGISKDHIYTIFEPLFTTKQQGTGLGLASVKSIVESHGGIISATSPPTVFTITLPKNNS